MFISTSSSDGPVPNNRFAMIFVCGALLVLSMAAGIILVVDPAGELWGRTDGYFISDTTFKESQISKYPHDILLIGSSKTRRVNPADFDDVRIFNSSRNGLNIPKMIMYLENYGRASPKIIIGLDFFMVNLKTEVQEPTQPSTARLWLEEAEKNLKYLLSWSSLKNSFLTIRYRIARKSPKFLPNGWRLKDFTPTFGADASKKPVDARIAKRNREVATRAWILTMNVLENSHFSTGSYAFQHLSQLKDFRKNAEKRGQIVTIFINPLHPCVIEMAQRLPSYENLKRFRNDVRTLFPDALDYLDSQFSRSENFSSTDPFHYGSNIGAEIICAVIERNAPIPRNSAEAPCVMPGSGKATDN